jgi:hypothetical protein
MRGGEGGGKRVKIEREARVRATFTLESLPKAYLIVVSLVHSVQKSPLVESGSDDRRIHRQCVEIETDA